MPSFQVDDCLSALEPRFMFDAAGVAVGAEAAADAVAQEQAEQAIDALSNDGSLAESDQPARHLDDQLLDALGSYESPADRREIVFIDTTVRDYQTLIAGIDKGAEVVLLDFDRDGIHQIASVLSGRTGIDAIHILSHGNQAELFLGTARLTLDSMSGEYKDQLALIGQALTANADLLIYGCNFGEGALGREATIQLAEITGADVAASADDTGHDRYGGDWDLEYQTGMIETSVALSATVQQNWVGKLAVINVDTFTDEVIGDGLTSLREAILQVNAGAGGDTIILPAGTYTLSLGSTVDDTGNEGDLDILKSVTIAGADAQSTIIDAGGSHRVFHILGGMADFSNITITGGGAEQGAGLQIESGATLNLSRVVVTGNTVNQDGAGVHNEGTATLTDVAVTNNSALGWRGGGIHNHGIMTLDRVTISGNTADGGAGIYHHGAGSPQLSLTNVTISNNTAANVAGGLYAGEETNIVNSTFTLNNAVNGGGVFVDAATVNISNTIVSGNTGTSANDDVVGSFSSDGSNLIKVVGAATGFGSDLTGVTANLDVLADNGGATQTHALLAGSPAIDNGTATGAPTVDQRGFTRDANVDIGAFEQVAVQLGALGEFLVNDTTVDVQETSAEDRGSQQAVAMAADGSYVVVWSSGPVASNRDVYAQRFDSSGNELTGQILVNENDAGNDQRWARVVSGGSGNFVVTWTSDQGAGEDVYARRFDSNGVALGPEFLANNTVSANQTDSVIAMDRVTGDFVIAWQGNGPGDGDGIFFRRFNADGTAKDAADRLANPAGVDLEKDPAIAMQTDGGFVIVWERDGGTNNNIYFQRFDSNGDTVGGDVMVDGGLSTSVGASVDSDAEGNFTIVYREENIGTGIWRRGFNADGTQKYFWLQIDNGDAASPSIDMADDGTHIVTYQKTGTGLDVYVKKYDANGSEIGSESPVNQTTTGTQSQASVAMIDTDNYVVVWSGEGPGDADGVFARQFGAADSPPTADAGGPYVITEGDPVTLDGSASTDDGTIVLYEWDLDNDGMFGEAGEPTGANPVVSWATLQSFGIDDDSSYTIGLRVTDDAAQTHTTTTTMAVNNLAPTLTTTGAPTAVDGNIYTLNLSATDPGDDTITGWTINWGDGTVETVAGNPTTITHTYTNSGFTFNILASATDEDGTFLQNELLVPRYIVDSVFRFEETTGAFLQQFAPQSGGLDDPIQTIIGPDGNLYVSGERSDNVVRYDSITGTKIDEFVTANSGGLDSPGGLVFGPDGNLYVGSYGTHEVLRFDGTTGAFLDAFVTGMTRAYGVAFGPDGDLYVNSFSGNTVLRYDGTTGAPLGTFVAPDAGGLSTPERMTFGPDGHLYIASSGSDEVLRYNGTTGAFINAFVTANLGGLDSPGGIEFGPDGNLYVGSRTNDNVLRYDGTTGAFLGEYVSATTGLDQPAMFTFLPGHQVLVTGNDAPIITSNGGGAAAAVDAAENQTSVTTVTATDADVPADTLTFSISGGTDAVLFSIDGSTGVLTFNSARDFEIPTDANADGVYEVTVEVDDGNGGVDTQALSVMVTADNDNAPVVTSPNTATVLENTTVVHQVTATDADLPGDTLSYSIAGTGADDTLFTIDGSGNLIFVAAPDFELPSDADGDNDYVVDVAVFDGLNTTVQAITVTVVADNDNAPVVTSPNTATVLENTTAVHQVTATDADLPGDTLSYSIAGTGADDALFTVDGGGNLSFLVAPDFEVPGDADGDNNYVVDVAAFDGVNTTVQTLTVTVISNTVNTPPVAADDTATIAEDSVNNNVAALGNDTDADDDSLTVSAVTQPANGTVMNNGDGTFTYTPNPDFNGVDSFSYTVSDGNGGTDTASVTVTVNPENDLPVAAGDSATTNEDTPVTTGNVLTNDTDIDGDSLTVSAVIQPANGTVINNGDGTFTYMPNSDFNGVDSFSYTVSDGNGGTDTASVTVTVNPENDPPVVTGDSATTNEDTAVTTGDVLSNDTDTDGDSLTVIAVTQPANGSVMNNGDGTFTYTPNAGFNGVDAFSYTVSDGNGGTDTASVTVTVTAANDPPLANADAATGDEGGTVTIDLAANDLDADDGLDLTSIDIVSAPSYGSLMVNGDGTVDYTHDGSENFSDSFSYRIRDIGGTLSNIATVAIDVTPVNDNAPVISSPNNVSVAENSRMVQRVTASDVDLPGNGLSYLIAGTGSDDALFNIDAAGNLSFLTAPDFEAPADANGDNVYTLDVVVSDGVNTTNQTVTVSVTAVNDNAPVITGPASAIVVENSTAVGQIVASDADLPAEDIGYRLTGGGADDGLFAIDAEGNLRFLSAPDFESPADADGDNVYVVEVAVTDGMNTVSQLMTVTVTQANAPVSVGTEATERSDTSAQPFDLSQRPSDVSLDMFEEPSNPIEDQLDANVSPVQEEPAQAVAQPELADRGPEAGRDLSRKQESEPAAIPWLISRSDLSTDILDGLRDGLSTNPRPVPAMDPLEVRGFVQELDRLRTEIHEDGDLGKVVIGSSVAVTTGLSIGYVVWLVRGAVLLSSMLSSLPAWRMVDPLPVLTHLGRRSKKDPRADESLETVIQKGAEVAELRRSKGEP